MVFRLRISNKLSRHQQQHPAFALFCYHQLLFINGRTSFPSSCAPQSCAFLFPLRSPFACSIQTSALGRSLDQKCDLLHQYGFAPSQVTALQANPVFRFARFEKVASFLCFLRTKGIGGAVAGKILTQTPSVLKRELACMETNCKIFEDLGLEPPDLRRLLSNTRGQPVLRRRTASLQKCIDFFSPIGLTKKDIGKVILTNPQILHVSVERKLEPTLAFFERHGMSKELFGKLVRLHPHVFFYSIDGSLTEKVEFINRLGLSTAQKNGSRAFLHWVSLRPYRLLSKWECLKGYGFSELEMLKIVKAHPQVLTRSVKVLKCMIEYWKNVLNRDLRELTAYSAYLTLSLQNRVKPRFTFLNQLKESGKGAKTISLSSMLMLSDESFERKYGNDYKIWKAGYFSRKVVDGNIL